METTPPTFELCPGVPLVPGSSLWMPRRRGVGARRPAAHGDARRVDAVLRRVRPQPADRGLSVVLGRDRGVLAALRDGLHPGAPLRGQEPVVDGSRHVAALGELAGERRERAAGLVAAAEAAAVDPHDRGPARLRVAGRLVEVELELHRVALEVRRAAVGQVAREREAAEDDVAVAQRRVARRGRDGAGAECERRRERPQRRRDVPCASRGEHVRLNTGGPPRLRSDGAP